MEQDCRESLSPRERARELLEKLSVEEKIAQVSCYLWGHGDSEEILKHGIGHVSTLEIRDVKTLEEAAEKLIQIQKQVMENSEHGIPAIFHMEGLCGALIQEATSFPSGVGRASSWDPELEEQIGGIVGRQERAVGITQTLAPVLDISRDSRMGRQCETYGEDCTLAAAMGSAYTRGVQGRSAGRQTDACAKHFLAFHNSLGAIHGANVEIGERQLREIYGKPFQAAIAESGLKGVMPCYCSVNGKPASASRELLTGLLREEMGFEGVVGADYSAIANVHTVQHLYESAEETGLACMEAGMDVELPSTYGYTQELGRWFAEGRADMAVLDRAVERVLCAKFRMGLFENPFALTGKALKEEFHGFGDSAVTLQSARESLVLLKNDKKILPIDRRIKKIALIGCHGDNARYFFGGYTHLSMVEAIHAAANSLAGVDAANAPGSRRMVTVPGTQIQDDETEEFAAVLGHLAPECPSLLEELRARLPECQVLYAYGYPKAGSDTSRFGEALAVAREADLLILTLGGKNGSGSIASMGEGVDGTNINLPECQEQFLLQAAELGKPMIGVHMDGRPISSDGADSCLDAVLEAWNPSEKGAQAIVDVLLVDYNPGGKLPLSVARTAGQSSLYYNHPNGSAWHQGESIGFSEYVDLPHTPRYFFGYGLSYTDFEYSDLKIGAACCADRAAVHPWEQVRISLKIQNTGGRAGDEVVQLYVRDCFATMTRPVKELAGFRRVHLEPGESRRVSFLMKAGQMAFLDENMRWKIEKGRMEVQVGASSEDIRLTGSYFVTEDGYTDSRSRGFYAECEEISQDNLPQGVGGQEER